MQLAFLDEAEPAAVSHAVRDVLERRGALVREHVSSRVLFQSAPTKLAWQRAGYVGVYQHVGEKEVEVRLLLRAKWPWRILWAVAIADVVGAVLTFVLNPPGTTWFVVAFAEGLALVVAGLTYLNTFTSTRDEERALMQALEDEFRKDAVSTEIEDEDARRRKEAELALAGEIEQRRVAVDRKNAPKPERAPLKEKKLKLNLGFGKKKGE